MQDPVFPAKELIDSVRGRPQTVSERCELAVQLTAWLALEANRRATNEERQRQAKLARLVTDPIGKAFAVNLADQCFRSKETGRVADQLLFLIERYGIPRFLGMGERLGLTLFQWLGRPLHRWMVPLVMKLIRTEASAVIIDENRLEKHLLNRRQEGVRLNLNHLGEAILGEDEAQRRLQIYLSDLANPEIDYISVKISTLYSQLNLLSREDTLAVLGNRLRQLYRESNGKFVNLDMEEYRDLHMTAELFQEVLSDPEFLHLEAGIVLQSYLPDSILLQQELTRFALRRVNLGGAPIKIRLVKGANLAMEQVEASLKGWPQAPYTSKLETDALFKRMLEYGCDNAHAVHLGIGSHNLFDIAYALLLRAEKEVEEQVVFEMLEGMADPLARVVKEISGGMLFYCPVADSQAFQYAIAYLVRRLDENTAKDNFLSDSFAFKPGSAAWERQEIQFRNTCEAINAISTMPRRSQSRFSRPEKRDREEPFANEPDTDWSLPHNADWAKLIVEEWKTRKREEIFKTLHTDALVATAMEAQKSWGATSPHDRSNILAEVAQLFRKYRGALIGVMAAETFKTVTEADVEVSEAIDFIEFYRRNVVEVQNLTDIHWRAKGVVLVASPWNFSCSIPAGGISAALAAGNSVIFKPAPEAVWVGQQLARIFWEGGISPELLQFVSCDDEPAGSALVRDPRISSIILTGATDTARQFLRLRPGLDLMAETGGKNAMIITRMADRDLAIRDLVQSAFGYAGQKCSACSLAICEAEVYDDPDFRRALKDAAASLITGSPWNLATRINPLIRTPGPALQRAMNILEEGEEWLLAPQQDRHNPLLFSPGIKLGVRPGSFTHHTELFGPILGVMRAQNLDQAITFANGTPYGLTAGIHTLDEREKNHWLQHIEAGNCYINRGITGAIVLRQPFGGCKASSFGPGAKAGGPNYVMQLMHPEQETLPQERDTVSPLVAALDKTWKGNSLWDASVGSYAFYWKHYFSQDHDAFKLHGQDNIIRYLPRPSALIVQSGDSPLDIDRARVAAATCGTSLELISEPEVIERLKSGALNRLRCLSLPSAALTTVAAQAGVSLIVAPVLGNGRLELLHYLREVSVSHDTHRYGSTTH
ncbi:MAG: proline dehydrogenase family protein [Parachlamydia sp.]|nr:proline dehydrogenase family protein [Parachlamydia sp.]